MPKIIFSLHSKRDKHTFKSDPKKDNDPINGDFLRSNYLFMDLIILIPKMIPGHQFCIFFTVYNIYMSTFNLYKYYYFVVFLF